MAKHTARWPEFMRWGGGGVPWKWSLGWWTGRDGDLLCVVPEVVETLLEELLLSPVCNNRFLALLAFLLKRMLVRLDANWVETERETYDEPGE